MFCLDGKYVFLDFLVLFCFVVQKIFTSREFLQFVFFKFCRSKLNWSIMPDWKLRRYSRNRNKFYRQSLCVVLPNQVIYLIISSCELIDNSINYLLSPETGRIIDHLQWFSSDCNGRTAVLFLTWKCTFNIFQRRKRSQQNKFLSLGKCLTV